MAKQGRLTAAGGVVWRDGKKGPEVLLVHRPHRNDWSLPKGKPEDGENDLDTAVREVTEETGVRFVLGARLGSVTYPVKGKKKTVSYWAMRQCERDSAHSGPIDDGEIDDLAWHSLRSAYRILSYPEDATILRTFEKRGQGHPSLILVRHASAGKRSEWSGDDADRPLDAAGMAQASTLRSLAAFAPARLFAAPLTRCVQTAQPIADATGLRIKKSAAFADAALKSDAADSLQRLRDLAGGSGGAATAVVSQGDLIAAALDDLPATSTSPRKRQKGSVWVFCAADGVITSADYYPPSLAP
ncbi:NUDIX hydrolase [Cumulibacter soli]|uniref:NUDIX hydrolase n=1 Tax=Cumulibacter soli TaxID=2546344 RepID=UPI001067D632|nr:NUDIX hydrolase [Cumulibacter soli]